MISYKWSKWLFHNDLSDTPRCDSGCMIKATWVNDHVIHDHFKLFLLPPEFMFSLQFETQLVSLLLWKLQARYCDWWLRFLKPLWTVVCHLGFQIFSGHLGGLGVGLAVPISETMDQLCKDKFLFLSVLCSSWPWFPPFLLKWYFKSQPFSLVWVYTYSWNIRYCVPLGLPRWLSGREFTCHCRQDLPWVGKISWRRKW